MKLIAIMFHTLTFWGSWAHCAMRGGRLSDMMTHIVFLNPSFPRSCQFVGQRNFLQNNAITASILLFSQICFNWLQQEVFGVAVGYYKSPMLICRETGSMHHSLFSGGS